MWFTRKKADLPPEIRAYYQQPRAARLRNWSLWAVRLVVVAAIIILLGSLLRLAYLNTHDKHPEVIQTVPKPALPVQRQQPTVLNDKTEQKPVSPPVGPFD